MPSHTLSHFAGSGPTGARELMSAPCTISSVRQHPDARLQSRWLASEGEARSPWDGHFRQEV